DEIVEAGGVIAKHNCRPLYVKLLTQAKPIDKPQIHGYKKGCQDIKGSERAALPFLLVVGRCIFHEYSKLIYYKLMELKRSAAR
ncbi:MAG: hypothetical protein RSD39_04550, partial [Oscillospiraceae bacterium]